MKSRSMIFPLLNFNLQVLPRNIWFLLVICSLNSLSYGIITFLFRGDPYSGEMSGIISSSDVIPFMFCGLLAMQFFITTPGWSGTVSLMPAGEFLLVRPVPRSTAYLSRMFLYFMIILMAPLLKISATFVEPDMRISLYHNKAQNTEVADKQALYRNQFPSSFVTHAPKTNRDMLVIPFGNVLVGFWELWLAIALALALQMATLLKFSSRLQIALLMAISLAPMLMISFDPFGNQEALIEDTVFLFAHYWALVAVLTLGVFILIQRIALRRIQDLEVI